MCTYLSDEAIPKGFSGETSPTCSQGWRSNQLVLWVHQRGAHPSPSPLPCTAPSGEFTPLGEFTLSWALQDTQQFGGKCARATRGTLTWLLHLFLLSQTGPVTGPHVPHLPLECQVCSEANMSQKRGHRLFPQLTLRQIAGGFPEISGGFSTADFLAIPKMKPNPGGELSALPCQLSQPCSPTGPRSKSSSHPSLGPPVLLPNSCGLPASHLHQPHTCLPVLAIGKWHLGAWGLLQRSHSSPGGTQEEPEHGAAAHTDSRKCLRGAG